MGQLHGRSGTAESGTGQESTEARAREMRTQAQAVHYN